MTIPLTTIELLQLLGLASIGSILGLTGSVIFLYNKRLSGVLERNAIPFAAGAMITVGFLGLLSESVHLIGTTAFPLALTSFFGAYIFEHGFASIHHHQHHHHGHGKEHDHDKDTASSVPLILLGDAIHNCIDGVAIGASFLINPFLGLMTALSTLLHEIPHEIGDVGLLLKAGWHRSKIMLVNSAVALTTIVGALSVIWFVENTQVIGSLLAIAAGIFIYLGGVDFLANQAHDMPFKKTLLPLILGIGLMVGTYAAIPHGHDETDHGSEIHQEETAHGYTDGSDQYQTKPEASADEHIEDDHTETLDLDH